MKKKILDLMYHLSVGNINYEYASKQVLDLFAVGCSHSFVEPKFFVDDKVWFKDNKGFEMEGKIVGVETHWSKRNESYHIYSLYKEGRKRLMHVGERNIIYKYNL